jgi:hypothetical protein
MTAESARLVRRPTTASLGSNTMAAATSQRTSRGSESRVDNTCPSRYKRTVASQRFTQPRFYRDPLGDGTSLWASPGQPSSALSENPFENPAISGGEGVNGWGTEDAQALFEGMTEDAKCVVAPNEDRVVAVGKQAADIPARHFLRLVDRMRLEEG